MTIKAARTVLIAAVAAFALIASFGVFVKQTVVAEQVPADVIEFMMANTGSSGGACTC